MGNDKLGKALRKKTKFWLLFLPVVIVSVPLIIFLIIAQMFLLAILCSIFLFFNCYLLYCRVCKRMKPKYPEMPPDGKPDIYYGSDIPRPIYEDMEQYPWFFKKKHKKAKKKHKQTKT